ncbi:solute carrier family 12 member 8-like [Amphibalanus amphitrite]|uniref:solute carrier family 12 member 8-like n=1 Tax=Amphibalanus amphitrite TaxID=1232801 RepID=UPI001C91F679|nr:solute carrier family 12 member 8-like [Amphibalanus amphitrite]
MVSVDWGRFGLSSEPAGRPAAAEPSAGDPLAGAAQRDDELFAEEQRHQPWWRSNFFVSSPVLFGTWDGVFTTVIVNIFGVIVLLRSGWMVAQAGIGFTFLIIIACVCVVLTSVLSAIGICERCPMATGGVYSLVSQVLGSHLGTAIGLVYCFGQAVGCALCAAAFGESMSELVNTPQNPWVERSVGVTLIALLTAINIAGVKWVIKVQFVLLALLALAVLDFLFGSLVGDPLAGEGYVGWSMENLRNNTSPRYTEGNNWFSAFGVFFPSLTGIMAGINMSGDLRNPRQDIPRGTLAALGASTVLYMLFAFVLAATCTREALLTDYIIAERVAATGVLLLLGLYISSSSSCLSTLYGTPRVLKSIANENIIRCLKPLSKVSGANQVPVYSLIAVSTGTLVFILIGQINRLAPIVTLPFLMTYAGIDYAYFALAHAYDIQEQQSHARQTHQLGSPVFDASGKGSSAYGAVDKVSKQSKSAMRSSWESTNTGSLPSSPEEDSSSHSVKQVTTETAAPVPDPSAAVRTLLAEQEGILLQPPSWYSRFCNRWVSLIGMLLKLVMMLLVNWLYCLLTVLAVLLIWLYARHASPGCPAALADSFSFGEWIKNLLAIALGRRRVATQYDRMVVTPMAPGVNVQQTQVTEENEDFEHRSRYHQSTVQPSKPLLADD